MNGLSDSVREKEAEEWLSNFPRLFDLYQSSRKEDPKNYFNFRELFPIAYIGSAAFAEIEKTLAQLDAESWEKLRKKTLSYITKNSSRRGYHQLFNGLNEARGYGYLAGQGYDPISFIDEDPARRLPDLLAKKLGSVAILEVKTVNQSDEDIGQESLQRHAATKVEPRLSEKFKSRILRSIRDAREQLDAYPNRTDRKIAFLFVHMDSSQSTCGESYAELDNFVTAQTTSSLEVIHQTTP